MVTLTFETWEEFDRAIAGITALEISLTNGVSDLTLSDTTASV